MDSFKKKVLGQKGDTEPANIDKQSEATKSHAGANPRLSFGEDPCSILRLGELLEVRNPTGMYLTYIYIYMYMYMHMHMYMHMYIYIYIYTYDCWKSLISSHMYYHGFMDNTNRQAVKNWLKSQTNDASLTSWRQPFCKCVIFGGEVVVR